ncbi:hypothetical protein ANAEL_01318 [Anaerolineales bacterium]|nr:hypothetical protein ANAEL_01318 [Anaerolineales bacterium]
MKSNPNPPQWINWIKELPDWIKATVGLVTIVISFVIAFRANYYLSIVIIATLAIISLFLLFTYVTFAKTPPLIEGGKGLYRFEKYRIVAFSGMVTILSIVYFVVALEPSRSFVTVALIGSATPPPTIAPILGISQVLMSESDNYYRLEVTVENPFEQDVLVEGITFSSMDKLIACYPGTEPPTYMFSDIFIITHVNGDTVAFTGAVTELNDEEFQYTVVGERRDSCDLSSLTLRFNTSFVLPAKSYSQFYLLFPYIMEMHARGNVYKERIWFQSYSDCKSDDSSFYSGYADSLELRLLTDKYGEVVTIFDCETR